MNEWRAALEAICPAPGGTSLLAGDRLVELLQRLDVAEEDAVEILRALPDPDSNPEAWRLLERASHAFRMSIGSPDAPGVGYRQLAAEYGAAGRCFWIYVFLSAVDDVRRWHQGRGIPEDVSWATLADLGPNIAACRLRTGQTGLDNPFWLAAHYRGLLYRLGRLQYIPYRLCTGPAGPLCWYDAATAEGLGAGFRPGDPAVSVHVPAGSPLEPEACDASIRDAKDFFARHFPEHTYRIMTCTSWLLDDQLGSYLPETSNLIRFQRRFEIVPGGRDDDNEIFRFVFGRPMESLAEVPRDTALRRAVLRHIEEGKHWRLRTGWLEP